ncbi:MAG: protein-disulfide reductase DsbD [Gammaproteobacteria bacterium]|nr:protein-disulfide reductase DsbD [Gammaproteobacteria bacterium]MDH5273837.1 protein-disulfide reductase DsbD [Gammaproteobacteria bacterium]
MPSIAALPVRRCLRLLVLLPLFAAARPGLAADDEFLPVRSAFKVATSAAPDELVVRFDIAAGYYLYRDRLGFESATPGVTLGPASLPVGLDHEDEFFGKQVIYRDDAQVGVPVTFRGTAQDFDVKVKLQGCADAGLCYPPQTWTLRVTWPNGVAGTPPVSSAGAAPAQSGGFNLRALLGGGAKSDADFLPADQAFVFSTESTSRDRVRLRWDIADDYYLYRDKVTVKTTATDVQLGDVSIPGGEQKHDEYFGEQVVFHDQMLADLPVVAAAGVTEVPLVITYQGCADAGLCYPPIKKTVVVNLASTAVAAAADGAARPMRSEQDLLADKIRDGNLFAVLATFFGFGLLLAFTPCVLPMVPILSGIIVGAGGGKPVPRGRAFALSVAYVLGMALTYTIAGAAFAAAGQQAQAFFQKPWMIALFAALFVWLALGMFGLFNLQVPGWLQERVSRISDKQQQGTLPGTAIMGALSSLIVTACVAPPLVASLAVIGQSGDVFRGGAALFAMSLGMGAPLLLVGASAGALLPRAGAWMDTVKQVFGIMMLGVAIWMLGRILPGPVTLALWATLAFVTGYWLLMMGGRDMNRGATVVRRGFGALAAIYGVLMLVGALSGRSDPLQPLAGVVGAPAGSPGAVVPDAAHAGAKFRRIKSAADLDAAIAAANAAGRTVMLDFYADWCVSCKEMEKYTFPEASVQAALANTVLLQADVTANDDIDQALMQRFGILGPPSILFFGQDGAERKDYRVVGFKPADEFAPHVQQAFGSQPQ